MDSAKSGKKSKQPVGGGGDDGGKPAKKAKSSSGDAKQHKSPAKEHGKYGKGKDFSAKGKEQGKGVKRERSNSNADSSRKAQFAESKAARKSRKPDVELVEEAKRIYNIVKPKDKALIVGGDRESLIHDLIKLIKGRAAKLVLKVGGTHRTSAGVVVVCARLIALFAA